MEMQCLPIPPVTYGHHHLPSLTAEIHQTYFFKVPPLRVRWGKQIARKKRRSIRLGSYNHVTGEIRIHPLLNSQDIPAFFIQSIIHHEYLHHLLGGNHNRRFHNHERQFRYHRESKEWIRRNLFILLGMKKRAAPIERPPLPLLPPQMALFQI